jgi:hypothetical protein
VARPEWEDAREVGAQPAEEARIRLLVLWSGLCVLLIIAYMVTYVLLRTSGDGRSWARRLLHPRRDSDRSG